MSDLLPLSANTLRLAGRGPHWATVADLDLGHLLDHTKSWPPIGIVGTHGEGTRVEGRFFPRVRYPRGWSPTHGPAILIRAHEDPKIVLAEAVHELGHWASYCAECKAVPQNRSATVRCRYKGEHDAEFYERLEPMYVAAGVPTYAARTVEGSYDYPPHWRAGSWP